MRGSRLVRNVLWLTLAAAVAVFCFVQDRVTAEGARRYVALQQDALAGRGRVVTIDEVMRPAIDRSVRLAFLYSGGVAVLGVAGSAAAARVVRRASRRSGRGYPSVP